MRFFPRPSACFVLACLLAAFAFPAVAGQPDTPPLLIRVGLVRQLNGARELTVKAPEGAALEDSKGAQVAKGPAQWTLTVDEAGRVSAAQEGKAVAADSLLRVTTATEETPLAVGAPGRSSSRRERGREHHYRGALEFRARGARPSSGLAIVNVLSLESYLRGVIAMEMPPESAPDALKAQVVASRTYALKVRSLGLYQNAGYDVTDTTACQVYGGADGEKASTDAAVRDTAGTILTHDGALIWADFYDDCGGVTSPGDGDGDFPPSVLDAPGKGKPDYCARGTYHEWKLVLSAKQAQAEMRGYLKPGQVLKDILVVDTDSSGRARTVKLIAGSPAPAAQPEPAPPADQPPHDGPAARTVSPALASRHRRQEPAGGDTVRTLRGTDLRRVLGYDRLRSTLFAVTRSTDGGFVFTGHGWGHGHGLCQWGAMGMATAPYHHTYREILEHYYPGAQLASLADSARLVQRVQRGYSLSSRGGRPGRLRRKK